MFNRHTLISAILLGIVSVAPLEASPLSANIGWNSDYIFRGIPQKDSSAFGGLDFEFKGAYMGTWAADVGDGLEIDFYGGYTIEVGNLSAGIGTTIYTYTGGFDDTYREFNFSLGYAYLTFDAAVGTYDNFAGPELDYQFYSLKAEYEGLYGVVGTFEDDFDGTYFEAGYGNTLRFEAHEVLDYNFAVLYSDSALLGGSSDYNLVLSVSKSFDW